MVAEHMVDRSEVMSAVLDVDDGRHDIPVVSLSGPLESETLHASTFYSQADPFQDRDGQRKMQFQEE